MIKDLLKNRTFLGVSAVVFYLLHGVFLVVTGEDPANLLWACHLGGLLVGFGLFLRRPILNSVGVLWLGLGNIMWILYLLGKGEFMVTSVLTHVGGLIIGILGVRKMGMVKWAWLWALTGLAALQQLCRWITPLKENINLAFRVHEGWEKIFPSYGGYLAVLLILAGGIFLFMEILLRKSLPVVKKS